MKNQNLHDQNLRNDSEFNFEEDDFLKAKRKGTGRWVIKHIFYKSNKYLMVLFFTLIILTSFFGSYIYVVFGKAIDTFPGGTSDQVVSYTFIVLFLGLGTPLAGLLARTFREIVAQRIERDVRREFYLSLLGKSQSFHDNQRIGDIMARATNDVRFLNFLISPALAMILDAVINLIMPIYLIGAEYRLELILIPIIFSVIFIVYLRKFLKKLAPPTIARRIAFGFMNTVLNESLSGIEVVKSMAQEEDSVEKYRDSAQSYRDAGVEQGDIQAKYLPILLLSVTVTLGLTITVFYDRAIISIGDILGIVGLLLRLRFPVNASIRSFLMVQEGMVGARRLLEIMNTKSEIYDSEDAISKEIGGTIKFEDVTFSYPGTQNKVLKKINFEVSEGQTVAIVGTTGSGKTTLTKLISRLYDVNTGRILIDGIDVRNYSLQSLRDQIAYIEQDIFIFSDSLFDNISFGRETSEEQVIAVAREAQAHQFIEDLPDMYQTEVGERGVQLSGGERQRVAIARAFLTEPKILILDDSSSAIDSETEERIQKAMFKILKGRTTFIITHRLSQIRWADLILVLSQGEIVNQGSHEYLLKNSEEYQKIFIKRFDKSLNELLGGE
ncbi:MAG: ABC transporter ATP-binding protein [Candidatus Lokiarchaeota archaeon]|nr:ABC transporter ATP-binding protein [Candidatus Lokiarchaeota archaeon]